MSRAQSTVRVIVCLLAATTSCARGLTGGGGGGVLRAKGTLQPKPGATVSGSVTAVEHAGVVRITVHVQGAEPGLHGLHVHEKGECTPPDFTSAGGHFNPTGVAHACPSTEPRHLGDFGNIEIGADGKGTLEITSDRISLSAGPHSVLGRALILHQGADDCRSQPAGESGGRLACAVITAE